MSRSNVRVRPAQPTDIPRLVTLANSVGFTSGAAGARHFEDQMLSDVGARFDLLLSAERHILLVAVDDEYEDKPLLGMVVVSDDEVGALYPVPVLRTSSMCVLASHRRHGVGRALLAAVVQLADGRGIEHVVATCAPGSRETNRYLARLGFLPLVSRRIAPVSVLRRSLGLGELMPERLAVMRRARIVRGRRADSAARAAIGRGA